MNEMGASSVVEPELLPRPDDRQSKDPSVEWRLSGSSVVGTSEVSMSMGALRASEVTGGT